MSPRQIYASTASRHERRWTRRRLRDPGWITVSVIGLAGAASWVVALLG